MRAVIIIHGTGGHPEENWFPWLKKELESLGCTVLVPKFPTPEGQSLYTWLETFKEYEHYMSDAILIGHSIGPAFLLNILEKQRAHAAFFVAGFTGLLGNRFDELNHTFSDRQFDWIRIKQHCQRFYVINSDDDPYVPQEKGEYLAEQVDGKFILLHHAGHINEAAGFTTFPFLLDLLKREL
jgi:uncharacterized protein